MSIAGYNVNPDSGDPIGGIEMNPYSEDNHIIDTQGRPTACLYVNEEEMRLTYEEVCNIQHQAAQVRSQMEWAMSVWAYASDRPWSEKTHIIRWPNKKDAKAFCGREPHQFGAETTEKYGKREWDLDPLFQPMSQCSSWLCQRCFKAYRKAQGHKEEKQG